MKRIKRVSLFFVALFAILLIPVCSHAQPYVHGGAGSGGTSQFGLGYGVGQSLAVEAAYFRHSGQSNGWQGTANSKVISLGASAVYSPVSVLGLDVLGKLGAFRLEDEWKATGGIGLQLKFGQTRIRLMRERIGEPLTTLSVVLAF